MALLSDKYTVIDLQQDQLHREQAEMMYRMCTRQKTIPHLLLHGPSGAGKSTFALGILKALFGDQVIEQRAVYKKQLKINGRMIDIGYLCSNYHTEFMPSELGAQDKSVIQDVLQDLVAGRSLSTINSSNGVHHQHNNNDGTVPFKVLVIHQVDTLSTMAQQALRRTMEKNNHVCRFILTCSRLPLVMAPIRSRCFRVRLALPSYDLVYQHLNRVAQLDQQQMDTSVCKEIAIRSNRNLRYALLLLDQQQQTVIQSQNPDLIEQVCVPKMFAEQSTNQIVAITTILYDLLLQNISSQDLLRRLTIGSIQRQGLASSIQQSMVEGASDLSIRLSQGHNPIKHLQALVIHLMYYIKFNAAG